MPMRKTIYQKSQESFKTGIDDINGYRKDDPALKSLKEFSIEDVKNELRTAKRETINRFTGQGNKEELDKKIMKIVDSYSYRSGVLSARGLKYIDPQVIAGQAQRLK